MTPKAQPRTLTHCRGRGALGRGYRGTHSPGSRNRECGDSHEHTLLVVGGWVPDLFLADAEEAHIGSTDVSLALNDEGPADGRHAGSSSCYSRHGGTSRPTSLQAKRDGRPRGLIKCPARRTVLRESAILVLGGRPAEDRKSMRQRRILPFLLIAGVLFAFNCTPTDQQSCSPHIVTTDAGLDGLPLDGPASPAVCVSVCSIESASCQRVGSNSVKCTVPCP